MSIFTRSTPLAAQGGCRNERIGCCRKFCGIRVGSFCCDAIAAKSKVRLRNHFLRDSWCVHDVATERPQPSCWWGHWYSRVHGISSTTASQQRAAVMQLGCVVVDCRVQYRTISSPGSMRESACMFGPPQRWWFRRGGLLHNRVTHNINKAVEAQHCFWKLVSWRSC